MISAQFGAGEHSNRLTAIRLLLIWWVSETFLTQCHGADNKQVRLSDQTNNGFSRRSSYPLTTNCMVIQSGVPQTSWSICHFVMVMSTIKQPPRYSYPSWQGLVGLCNMRFGEVGCPVGFVLAKRRWSQGYPSLKGEATESLQVL